MRPNVLFKIRPGGHTMTSPALLPLDPARCLANLESIVSGWNGKVSATIETLPLAHLESAIEFLALSKVRHAEHVLAGYRVHQLPPFVPVMNSADGVSHLGVLVELTTEGALILDGCHRSFTALQAGLESIRCSVIRRERRLPPPCPLIPLADVALSPGSMPGKFTSERPALFRPAQEWVAQWAQQMRCEVGEEEL